MVRQRTTFTVPLHLLKGFVIIVKLIEKIAKNRSFWGLVRKSLRNSLPTPKNDLFLAIFSMSFTVMTKPFRSCKGTVNVVL